MSRPYFEDSIQELTAKARRAEEELERVWLELCHRQTTAADELRTRIRPWFADEWRHDQNLYVIELNHKVLEERRFWRRNQYRYRDGFPCLYVGKTARTPEKRFEQHKAGIHAARFVERYGERLRPEFYERLNPLTRAEAEAEEVELARLLRREGYGVWQN